MKDIDSVFDALAGSPFRRKFQLQGRDLSYLDEKGLATVLDHSRRFVDQRLAPAEPLNDGKQTPMRGHPAFVAQHATGTCCRSCLAKWHGIARGHLLGPNERNHIVAVLERWLRSEQSRRNASCA